MIRNISNLEKRENKEIKEARLALSKYKPRARKKNLIICSSFSGGMWLLFTLLQLDSYSSTISSVSINLYLFLMFSAIGILIFLLIDRTNFGQRKIHGVVTVSGYLRKHTRTVANVVQTFYYFDLVSSSKPIGSTTISEVQIDVISRLFLYYPDKLYTVRAAILAPKTQEKLTGPIRDGHLLLLPVEDYLKPDYHLEEIDNGYWQAPLEFGNEPNFFTPRQGVTKTNKDLIVCESPLSPTMDFIDFEHLDHETLKEKTRADDIDIKNVIAYTSQNKNGFMDFQSSIKTLKTRQGSYYLYCLFAAYLVNYLFIDGLNHWPNVSFWINIFITGLLITICMVKIFFPLRIKLPIRFHRKNKEIYVSINKSLYKIPWDKSDFSIVARQTSSNVIYDLTLWLDPQYDINQQSDKVVPFTLFSVENIHSRVYFYWDYINRYMNYASYFDTNKNIKEKLAKKADENSLSVNILCVILMPILIPFAVVFLISFIISDPFALRNKLNPFKNKWPKVVNQWSKTK